MIKEFIVVEIENGSADIFRQLLIERKFPPGKQKIGDHSTLFKIYYDDPKKLFDLAVVYESRRQQQPVKFQRV